MSHSVSRTVVYQTSVSIEITWEACIDLVSWSRPQRCLYKFCVAAILVLFNRHPGKMKLEMYRENPSSQKGIGSAFCPGRHSALCVLCAHEQVG